MRIKRFLTTAAILTLMLALSVCLASCPANKATEHTHNYSDGEIVTEATCNQEGLKKYTCMIRGCGHSYTEPYSLPTYTPKELFDQSVKYVGEIKTYDKQGDEFGLGTGFVISSDGKIVTNYHVIDTAYSADITIDGKTYKISSVLAYDENIDLAVLKIKAEGLTPATLCKNPVSVGSTVYAIGSSRGMTNTYSQGIITYADRVVEGVSHIQHDASITNGNSGGSLINEYGEVIGINSWGMTDSQNLNFAVFVGELDNLEYKTTTLIKMYNETTPQKRLAKWILKNYTASYSDGELLSYEYDDDGIVYSINYDVTEETLYVDIYDNYTYFGIDLYGESSKYECFLSHEDKNNSYTLEGTVNVKTYKNGGYIAVTAYQGSSYLRTKAVDLAHTALSMTVNFFDSFLDTHNLGLTMADFGFLAYN